MNRPSATPLNKPTVTAARRPLTTPVNRPSATPVKRVASSQVNRPSTTQVNRPVTTLVNRPTVNPVNRSTPTVVNKSWEKAIKHFMCFHKRCVHISTTFKDLRNHCAKEHDYVGSMKCGKCHRNLANEESHQRHTANCGVPFQCIDCGRFFFAHKEMSDHIALPWCERLPNYKLMYPQTARSVSYSFVKSSVKSKKRVQTSTEDFQAPTRCRPVMRKRSGYQH